MNGTQAPEDIVANVDGVLNALGEKGPYVLLGASFGGLVAGAYAVAHPDRTAGILLLDSAIPDDSSSRRDGFQGACLEANRQADAWESLERIDNCRLAKWSYDRRDRKPEVPLIYLAAEEHPSAQTRSMCRSKKRSSGAGRPASGTRSAHRTGWMKPTRSWS